MLEAWLAHVPGLKVVAASNPADAYGLLYSSIMDPNPVIFIENTEEAGGEIIQEVSLPGGVGGAFYADYGGGPGTIIEYLQIPQAGIDGFAAMRQMHLDWDGQTNPVIGKDQ